MARKWVKLVVLLIILIPLTGCVVEKIEKLGDKAFEKGKYSLALRAYQFCLKRDIAKNNGRAQYLYYKIGLCLENMGKFNEAAQAYQMVIKVNPISGLSAKALKRLIACKTKAIFSSRANVASASTVPGQVAGTTSSTGTIPVGGTVMSTAAIIVNEQVAKLRQKLEEKKTQDKITREINKFTKKIAGKDIAKKVNKEVNKVFNDRSRLDKLQKEVEKAANKLISKLPEVINKLAKPEKKLPSAGAKTATNLTAGQIFAQIKALEHQYNRALERGDLAKAQEIWNEKMKLERKLMRTR